MPENNQPLTLPERLVEKSIKTMEKDVADQTTQRLERQQPQQILQSLLQSLGQQVSQEDVLKQVQTLAETPVGTGERLGLIPSLLRGKGFRRPEMTEELGMGSAIQILKLQQDISKSQRQIPKEQIDVLLGLLNVAKETGNKELFETLGGQKGLTRATEIQQRQIAQKEKETLEGQDLVPTGFNQFGQPTGYKDLNAEVKRLKEEGRIRVKVEVAKDALKRVNKLQGLIPVLDQFDTMLEAIPVGTGVAGRGEAIGKAALGFTEVDPFITTVQSQAEALRPQIARGFGDVGNLSIVEQKTAGKFIPRVADSADTRVLKSLGGLSFIMRKLDNAVQRAGLGDDEDFRRVQQSVQERIEQKIQRAIQLGIDKKRIDAFLGRKTLKPGFKGKALGISYTVEE